MKIFIGCTMKDNISDSYKLNAQKIATKLAENGYDLVFGACNHGLMGEVYRMMKIRDRHITGIAAEIYKEDFKELECDEEIIINSITERNNKFLEHSDAMLFLEGGTGTLGELFTLLETKKSSKLDIPIVIYNGSGYYNNLLEQFKAMFYSGMLSEDELTSFQVCYSPEECVEYLNSYQKGSNTIYKK